MHSVVWGKYFSPTKAIGSKSRPEFVANILAVSECRENAKSIFEIYIPGFSSSSRPHGGLSL